MAHIRRRRILVLLLLLLAISASLWPKEGGAQARVTHGKLPAGWQEQPCDSGWAECALILLKWDRQNNSYARVIVEDLTNAPSASAQPSDQSLPQDGFSVGVPIFLRQFNSTEELRSRLASLFPDSRVTSSPTVKLGGYDAYHVSAEVTAGQSVVHNEYYWVNVPGTPVGIIWDWEGALKGEAEAVIQSLCFDAKCGASSSVPPTPTPSPCTPAVRGLGPQKPGDVISPGATYRDASGKEVGIIQERWYINGKETTSAIWDGKSVAVEHQWTCLDHTPHSQTHTIAAYQSAPPPPGQAGASPTAGGSEIVDSPVPGLGNAGQVPGPASLPQAVTGVVLPGLIAIGVSILGGVLGSAPKPPVVPPAGAAPLPPALPPVLPIPTPPATVPFPAAPPVAGGTVALPPAGPPSTAGTPAKPAPASPEDKQKAKAEIRQKQEEAIKEHDKATAEGDRWGWWEDLAGTIKSGADLGVNILSTVTGPAGKAIKSGYDTLSVIADHTGGAIADGNVRGHIIGAVSDVASGKLTDMMTGKVGDAAGWAGGKLADKIGKALPGQIKQTVAGGIGSISNKIFGTGNTSYGSSLDLGGATVTKTIKSIFGTSDLSGQVRTKIWEADKDQATDWAKGKASDQFIKQTTGGKIEDADDYKKKLSDIAQATINDKLDSWGRKPKPGVERFR